jgi:hypothetical protein
MPTSTFTPTVTPTLTPTPTPTPAITAEEWASDEKTGNVDPTKMYPLVGAINHKHRFTLDLGFGTMRLAVVTDKDLTKVPDHRGLRATIGVSLAKNEALRQRLLSLLAQMAQRYSQESDFRNFTVIVEGGKISQAIYRSGDTLVRYSVDAKGALTEMKEPYQLLPELYVENPLIKRADTGETLVFKGISIFLTDGGRGSESIYNYVKWVIERSERLGIKTNLVRLSFHSENLDNPTSLDDFNRAVDWLALKGIYVILTPHNDQRAPDGSYSPFPIPQARDNYYLPNEHDKQIMVDLAARLKNRSNVIYGIWNEFADADRTTITEPCINR